MSHVSYNKQWTEAQNTINELLQIEIPPEPPRPERDRIAAFQNLAVLYIKYIQIFRKLEQCFDQIVHPQKRLVLRHVLDGAMGRILELKNNMVTLEFAEYHYFDDVLSDLKLTPNDIEIPIPKYFLQENKESIIDREKMMRKVLQKTRPHEYKTKTKEEIQMSKSEAIQIIQIHERARQGRLRAKFMKEIRIQEERERLAATRGAPTLDRDVAAVRIQKIWKGYKQRKVTAQMREEEFIFVGMKPGPPVPYEETPMYSADQQMDHRRVVQLENEREYQKALVSVKEKLRDVEGPEMREKLQDDIRKWFIECRDSTGKFPEYPSESDGGSASIFKPIDPAEAEAELKAKDEEKAKGKGKDKKGKKGKGKDKKDKKGKGKDKKGKKGKGEDEDDQGIVFDASLFVPTLAETNQTYKEVWEKRDETLNYTQKHDVELIKEKKRIEVETEIRLHVDELMRTELKNLKLAVDRSKGKKGKKGKGKSGKKKKGKKGGKKSGKKGGRKKKKEKDLTADRTIESLYQELVKEGILVQYQKIQLKEYVGEYSYLGTTLRQANIEPMPSLSDVRRVITAFCILPLGSQIVHEKAPFIKSVLITGPSGTGKKMLVRAICTETGANMFDLTATNILGKYPGKAGLKMMLHMVFKVARQLQPSVVFIGDCEKTFQKKIPKTDKSEPKRLKKDLPKILKGLKAEDRVLVVGTSTMPFNAEMKPFCNMYQKLLLIPRPDYASRFLLWPSLIRKYGGQVTEELDVSSLAKVTDGYTPGHMVASITSVLTGRRIKQMSKKPLIGSEFIGPLAKIEPIYKDVEEAFKIWYAKTPLGKKRTKAAKEGKEGSAGGKKEKGKKGGGKGGKKKK